MEVEYIVSTGKQIAYGVFAALLVAVAFVFLSLSFRQTGNLLVILPVIVCVVFILLSVLVGGQLRKKVIISPDKVVVKKVIQTKEIATADIKGCRIGTKNIIIESVSPSGSRIIINNYPDFIDSEDLKKWLQDNFKDLDVSDLAEEQSRLLNDRRLGATKEEREAKITQSKWIGWTYTALGMFFGFVSISTLTYYNSCDFNHINI